MLVITRKVKEKVLFPDFSTSVEVLGVKSGKVRLGICAPRTVSVVREEIADKLPAEHSALSNWSTHPLFRELKHALRNRLNAASVGMALARRQLQLGDGPSAERSLQIVSQEFEKLKHALNDVDQNSRSPREDAGPPEKLLRVLLVEDDRNESRLLAGYLRHVGIDVTMVGDGLEAISAMESEGCPDVILMDMMLPRCDGPTTIHRIRENPEWERAKIIAVSGREESEFPAIRRGVEVDGWYKKPLDPEALVSGLKKQVVTMPA